MIKLLNRDEEYYSSVLIEKLNQVKNRTSTPKEYMVYLCAVHINCITVSKINN